MSVNFSYFATLRSTGLSYTLYACIHSLIHWACVCVYTYAFVYLRFFSCTLNLLPMHYFVTSNIYHLEIIGSLSYLTFQMLIDFIM